MECYFNVLKQPVFPEELYEGSPKRKEGMLFQEPSLPDISFLGQHLSHITLS